MSRKMRSHRKVRGGKSGSDDRSHALGQAFPDRGDRAERSPGTTGHADRRRIRMSSGSRPETSNTSAKRRAQSRPMSRKCQGGVLSRRGLKTADAVRDGYVRHTTMSRTMIGPSCEYKFGSDNPLAISNRERGNKRERKTLPHTCGQHSSPRGILTLRLELCRHLARVKTRQTNVGSDSTPEQSARKRIPKPPTQMWAEISRRDRSSTLTCTLPGYETNS